MQHSTQMRNLAYVGLRYTLDCGMVQ